MTIASGNWFNCVHCKVGFWLTTEQEAHLRQSGQNFHCLWGHSQHFVQGPTEAETLRRERDRLKQEAARLTDVASEAQRNQAAAERRAAAARGQVTKLKRSASAGHCPACAMGFPNLKRHIEAKHPEFVAEAVEGESE